MPYPYYTPYGQAGSPYTVYPNYYMPQIPAMNYQPNYPQQNVKTPEQPKGGMLVSWVKSEKDVDNDYVGPNSAAAYWNENEPVLYLKQADATGKTSLTIYDLVERKVEEKEEIKQEYATSSDFNSLVGAVNNINESLNKEIKSFATVIESLKGDVDSIKADMYGIAGKKKTVRKAEGEEDA